MVRAVRGAYNLMIRGAGACNCSCTFQAGVCTMCSLPSGASGSGESICVLQALSARGSLCFRATARTEDDGACYSSSLLDQIGAVDAGPAVYTGVKEGLAARGS